MAFSEVIFSDWQPQLFSGNLKQLFKRNEDILIMFYALRFLKYLDSYIREFLGLLKA